MRRASLLSVVLLALLAACIHHPPETLTVERPLGPVVQGINTDTSTTYLVVDRRWSDDATFFDEVEADTAVCEATRQECLQRYDGEIEKTILTIRPAVSAGPSSPVEAEEMDPEAGESEDSRLLETPPSPSPRSGSLVTSEGAVTVEMSGDYTTISHPDGTSRTVWTPQSLGDPEVRTGSYLTEDGVGVVETIGDYTTIIPPEGPVRTIWTPQPVAEADDDSWP